MKTEINDGGSAFPSEGLSSYGGMSLRDYFARHAPIANFIAPSWDVSQECLEKNAELAYRWADAMIKAKNK